DFPEKVRNRLRFYGAVAADVAITGLKVQLDISDSGTILTPGVLFFHQDVHLVYRESRAVLMEVVGQRLPQPDECDSALVINLVRHVGLKRKGNFINPTHQPVDRKSTRLNCSHVK